MVCVPQEEEQGGGRRGQGEGGMPCLSLYHRETSYFAFGRGAQEADQLHGAAQQSVPPIQGGRLPDVYGLPSQGPPWQETQGGSGHHSRQPDHPPQL